MPIKVLIYDDNDYLRSSIKMLLEWNSELDVVAAMPNATEVLKDIQILQPDVIIMDIDMPPSNGVTTVKEIRAANIDLPIIMLTVFEDNDNIVNAICAGASGYLLKKDITNLETSIKDVLNGGAPMTSLIAKKVLQLFPLVATPKKELPTSITKREVEILNELVKGNSYKMIAASLDISLETVRTHLKSVYKKLQVNSATEAVYKITH